MHRINAYSEPTPDGGVTINLEGMLVDIITVTKAGGITREMLIDKIREMWNEVKVEIEFPNEAKN